MQTSPDNNHHILVVEDNHLDILTLKVLLGKHFNLHIVTNGHDALSALESMHFDIILSDINLGNDQMDGCILAKLIRQNKNYNGIKLFALTISNENESFFVNQGFDALLTKPVIKEEIFDIINKSFPKKNLETNFN